MRRSQLPPIVAVFVVSILWGGSCAAESSAPAGDSGQAQGPAGTVDPAAFVDRVWRVAESPQVQTGSLRVFLSDGTLVLADPHAEPALGTWALDAGQLTITEEGQTYPVDILELNEQVFRIRIRGPGEPIDIRFEPATAPAGPPAREPGWTELAPETTGPTVRIAGTVKHKTVEGGVWVIRSDEGSFQPTNLPPEFQVAGLAVEAEGIRRDDMVSIHMVGPLLELVRIRRQPATHTAAAATGELWGSRWILEDLAGAGVLDDVQATLEFPEPGRIAGNASCNRFFGSVETSADALKIGPLGTTRRACAEAVNDQERRYLAALEGAERFAVEEPYLLISSKDRAKPLRFTRAEP